MDSQDLYAIDAVIVTDRAGFIRAVNTEAAKLLNVGMRGITQRELALFFVKGRVEILAALRDRSAAPLRADVAVIQPIDRHSVAVTVDVTQEDDGLQWVLRRVAEEQAR
jgi:nitrogen-specific signal transduction histidine kinase